MKNYNKQQQITTNVLMTIKSTFHQLTVTCQVSNKLMMTIFVAADDDDDETSTYTYTQMSN